MTFATEIPAGDRADRAITSMLLAFSVTAMLTTSIALIARMRI